MKNTSSFVWLLVSVIVLAVLGVVVAFVQIQINGNPGILNDKGVYQTTPDFLAQYEYHQMSLYALIGAVSGLVLGLINMVVKKPS